MILEFIKTENSPPSLIHLCFKFLYLICKVSSEQLQLCDCWMIVNAQALHLQMFWFFFLFLNRSEVIKSSCSFSHMRLQICRQFWTCCLNKIQKTTRWDGGALTLKSPCVSVADHQATLIQTNTFIFKTVYCTSLNGNGFIELAAYMRDIFNFFF